MSNSPVIRTSKNEIYIYMTSIVRNFQAAKLDYIVAGHNNSFDIKIVDIFW